MTTCASQIAMEKNIMIAQTTEGKILQCDEENRCIEGILKDNSE